MPKAVPPCPTADDALCQALLAAVESLPDGGVLADAEFGRFADLDAGWHWTLKIIREITSEHPHLRRRDGDTLARRMKLVIQSWHRCLIRYEQDFTPREPS